MLNKPTVDSKRRLQALRRWQARLLTASAVNFASSLHAESLNCISREARRSICVIYHDIASVSLISCWKVVMEPTL